ncbi:methyltransferase domain-containing protein [Cellulomonas sp. DKR-3]|uniref:Methyltransferase domain-containing protein n=1 Tax=Cellulomonas fulva TaxID=2835530 RepID=A0ABS5TXC0_9CELL|nr:class I SAM-dependent methyltransferase [Cellulomonas fulva]MBT0993781.1 methyltransferase domain-containing protein [Cellulomonas fulva]
MAAPEGPAAVFDRVADTYDTVGVPWFVPIAAALVAQLAVRPGERVLDVGCGRGAALRPLAEATGPGGHALGIDLAPRMVELTSADLAHLPQVDVRVGDARAPDLPPESFDVVAASLVLFFLPDPVAALSAWRGLLVPGGRVGVTTFGAQDERWREIDALFAPFLPPGMFDARASGRRGPYASDEGVEQLLVEAGFTDVRTVSHTVAAVFRGPEHVLEFSWSHGQRAMWDTVPPDRVDELRTAMAAAAARAAEPSGRIAFTQQVRQTLGSRPR